MKRQNNDIKQAFTAQIEWVLTNM